MRLIKFTLSDVEAAAFDRVVCMREFYNLKPKTVFVMHLLDILHAEKEKTVAATPKQPTHRETAEERKKREREEFDERKLAEYRSTGEWPRVKRNEKGSGHQEGSAFILDGCIMFTKPGDPDRLMAWEPPEDYPFMDDYRKAQRELAERYTPPIDPNYPKQEDYDTDEEFYDAENLYLRTTERDAIDAMPSVSTNLADELQALLDAG